MPKRTGRRPPPSRPDEVKAARDGRPTADAAKQSEDEPVRPEFLPVIIAVRLEGSALCAVRGELALVKIRLVAVSRGGRYEYRVALE